MTKVEVLQTIRDTTLQDPSWRGGAVGWEALPVG
jgi:hypothetical protein